MQTESGQTFLGLDNNDIPRQMPYQWMVDLSLPERYTDLQEYVISSYIHPLFLSYFTLDGVPVPNSHRETPLRLMWVYRWIGPDVARLPVRKPGYFQEPNDKVTRLIDFLKSSWTDRAFHPFATRDGAIRILKENPRFGAIYRLSSSVPGMIAVTYYLPDGRIGHTLVDASTRHDLLDIRNEIGRLVGRSASYSDIPEKG